MQFNWGLFFFSSTFFQTSNAPTSVWMIQTRLIAQSETETRKQISARRKHWNHYAGDWSTVTRCQSLTQTIIVQMVYQMGCAGAKDEVMNIRATFGTVGKFPDLTADLIPDVIGKKLQGGAEEEYKYYESLREEVLKLLKRMTDFQRRVCWIWSTWRLRGATQNQNRYQAFNRMIWSPCQRQEFQCQLSGGSTVFSPGTSPFKPHWSDLCVCVCAWRTGTVSPVTSLSSIWSRMMLRKKSSRMSTTRARKEEERGWERGGKVRKEASREGGSFSWTRWIFNKFCFLFGVFYGTL